MIIRVAQIHKKGTDQLQEIKKNGRLGLGPLRQQSLISETDRLHIYTYIHFGPASRTEKCL